MFVMQHPVNTTVKLGWASRCDSKLVLCCAVCLLSCRLELLICQAKILEVGSSAPFHDPKTCSQYGQLKTESLRSIRQLEYIADVSRDRSRC